MSEKAKQIRLNDNDKETWELIKKHLEENLGPQQTEAAIIRFALWCAKKAIEKEQPAQ